MKLILEAKTNISGSFGVRDALLVSLINVLQLLLDVGFLFYIHNLCITIVSVFRNLCLLVCKLLTENLHFFLEESKIRCALKYHASICLKCKSRKKRERELCEPEYL